MDQSAPPTPEQLQEFFAELKNAAPCGDELSVVAGRYTIRQVLLAMGLMLGNQAQDNHELHNFIGVIASVALSHRRALAAVAAQEQEKQ